MLQINKAFTMRIVRIFCFYFSLFDNKCTRMSIQIFAMHNNIRHYFPENMGAQTYALVSDLKKLVGQMLGYKIHQLLIGIYQIGLNIQSVVIPKFIDNAHQCINFVMRHYLLYYFIFAQKQGSSQGVTRLPCLKIEFPQTCLLQHLFIG